MGNEERDRLVRVEVGLEHVREQIQEHREDSRKRDSDLKDLIEKLGVQIDDSQFRWRDLFKPESLKVTLPFVASGLGYIIGRLSGWWG